MDWSARFILRIDCKPPPSAKFASVLQGIVETTEKYIVAADAKMWHERVNVCFSQFVDN